MGYTHGTNFFRHFPEVIFVDSISDTNKDKLPLLTIKGKDSFGKMLIILRAFLPNERAWVLQWIFTIVLPTLFPRYLPAFITDGCPREFMQINMATKIYFKNTLRIRCGFHLVQMGWTHCVIKKNCYPSSVGVFYDNVCNHLKAWIYSWMKSSCETQKEFLVSKLLSKKFLNTKQIKSKLGKSVH